MVWERRSYNDGSSVRCTVKYRGNIPQWGDAIALGVEWDDPRRGKNDGVIDGVRYFTPRFPKACSFVRESRPTENALSFAVALAEKYLHHIDHDIIQLSETKFVETYGFDKVEKSYQDSPSLIFLSLDASKVKHLQWDNFSRFENLHKSDLGNNLLEKFSDIPGFLNEFPSLKSVRLSGNKSFFDFNNTEPICRSIETLELAEMSMIDDEMFYVLARFPNLKVLSCAHNLSTRVPSNLSNTLEELDMSENVGSTKIGELPETLRRASFRGTSLSQISPTDRLCLDLDLRQTDSVKEDDNGHLHVDWNSISELARQNVETLQLLGALYSQARGFVIGRCSKSKILDGTRIGDTARSNAEKHLLKAVASKEHPRIPIDRWNELIESYGEPYVEHSHSIQDRLIAFYVDNHPKIIETSRDAPLSRLRISVARITDQDASRMEIKGITDNVQDYGGRSAELLQVQDVISDGDRLITYIRPSCECA